MARDAKLNFTWTAATTPTVANGGLQITNFAATGTTSYAWVFNNAASTAYFFNRASSNALNKSGFRDQTADQSLISTSNSVVSAIANDPSVFGNTEMYEAYVRVTYGQLGAVQAATTTMWLLVEAASDSGTGTAGTDWSPVSSSINVGVSTGTLLARPIAVTSTSSGVFTVASAHGLQPGDIIVATAATTAGGITLELPYYINTVPSSTTFTLASSFNGATLTSLTGGATITMIATPSGRRVLSIPVSPTAKPWLRVSVYATSGSTALAKDSGVWIQDAFITVSRDSAAVA